MSLQLLISHCTQHQLFRVAVKKLRRYRRTESHEAAPRNTYCIHQGPPVEIVTVIHGKEETRNEAQHGDYIITGPFHEQYVVRSAKVPDLYNMDDTVLITRTVKRTAVPVTKSLFNKLRLPNPLTVQAQWGPMLLKPGDILVKDNAHFYCIDKMAFSATYKWEKHSSLSFVGLPL